MRRVHALFVSSVLLSVTLTATGRLPDQTSLHDGVTRTVYVSVLKGGTPVTDLSADDFVVKEGGKDREITRAEAEARKS